jgi:hypothetical protein
MPLKPFDELETEVLRFLGFTISVMRGGNELAVLAGEMKVEIRRGGTGDDQVRVLHRLAGRPRVVRETAAPAVDRCRRRVTRPLSASLVNRERASCRSPSPPSCPWSSR